MSRTVTRVHLQDEPPFERFLTVVTDPRTLGEEEVWRLLLDVPRVDADFLEQFAAYRNALAAVQGKKLKRRWSRKSLAETIISEQCDVLRKQLAEMFAVVGPLPKMNGTVEQNRAAMEKYARRVIDWTDKHPSK